jgi:hypothetical protein
MNGELQRFLEDHTSEQLLKLIEVLQRKNDKELDKLIKWLRLFI